MLQRSLLFIMCEGIADCFGVEFKHRLLQLAVDPHYVQLVMTVLLVLIQLYNSYSATLHEPA